MFFRSPDNIPIHITCAFAILVSSGNINAQVDPGPRGGPAGAGGYFPALNADEQLLFNRTLAVFREVDSVSGTLPGEPGSGLGPSFNGNSCAMCHAQPAVGGSSPGMSSKQNPVPNPQVALATLDGATNTVPAFITLDGPVREARFVASSTRANLRDGGVHGLFTIKGRKDAPGCQLDQPDFATQLSNHNVIFRIPTATFGLGLVENTPDAALQDNLAANQAAKAALGIGGRFNTSGNDGSITRFGWKAQNKSLFIFAGEAYNVEQGVSNHLFPNERSAVMGCVYNATPEDAAPVGNAADEPPDIMSFAMFMKLLAPPAPTTTSASEKNGQALFVSTGCAMCHSPSLTSATSPYTGMSNVLYHPYSDFALHHMGSNLADGISQGAAGPDEFRTAPLWGAGQRLFFLHDGRTSDLLQAIQAHSSAGVSCPGSDPRQGSQSADTNCTSEANAAISKFNTLTTAQKQDILNFLRSL